MGGAGQGGERAAWRCQSAAACGWPLQAAAHGCPAPLEWDARVDMHPASLAAEPRFHCARCPHCPAPFALFPQAAVALDPPPPHASRLGGSSTYTQLFKQRLTIIDESDRAWPVQVRGGHRLGGESEGRGPRAPRSGHRPTQGTPLHVHSSWVVTFHRLMPPFFLPHPLRSTRASCPAGSATTASPAAGWASCARSKLASVRATVDAQLAA